MTLRLLAITPPVGPVDPALVDVWLAAGVRRDELAVLLREPGQAPEALLARGHRFATLRAACAAAGISCLVACDLAALDDAVACAREGRVRGVHLRGDPPQHALAEARRRLGSDAVLGRACHGEPAPGDGFVDYSCIAPIFAPRTMTPGRVKIPVGLERLAAWAAVPGAHPIALGGIAAQNAGACLRAGAAGLASIRGFFGPAPRVAEDVAGFVRALDEHRDEP